MSHGHKHFHFVSIYANISTKPTPQTANNPTVVSCMSGGFVPFQHWKQRVLCLKISILKRTFHFGQIGEVVCADLNCFLNCLKAENLSNVLFFHYIMKDLWKRFLCWSLVQRNGCANKRWHSEAPRSCSGDNESEDVHVTKPRVNFIWYKHIFWFNNVGPYAYYIKVLWVWLLKYIGPHFHSVFLWQWSSSAECL